MFTTKEINLRILLPISFGTAISLLGDTAIYLVLPTSLTQAGVILAQLGILLSANRIIRLFLNGPIGYWIGVMRRKPFFVGALLLATFTNYLYAYTTGFWPLLIGRILWGVAWSSLWISANTMILDASEEHNRGRLVGTYQMSFFGGAALGTMISGVLRDAFSYQGVFIFAMVATFIAAVVAQLLLIETKPDKPLAKATEIETKEQPNRMGELAATLGLLGTYRLTVAGMLTGTFALYMSESFGESLSFFGREWGITSIAGIFLGIGTFISVIASPLFGALSDHWGNRWRVIFWGTVIGVVGYGLLTFTQPLLLVAGVFLLNISSGGNQSMATTLMGDLGQHRGRGILLGLLYTIGDLTSAIGPFLAFNLLIPNAGIRSVYIFSAIALGFMAVVAGIVTRSHEGSITIRA